MSNKLCTLQGVHNPEQKHKNKYREFLHESQRSWISETKNPTESSSDELQQAEEEPIPRGPEQDYPGRLSGSFSRCKLEKIIVPGQGKEKYPARQCKVSAHPRRSVKQDTFVHLVFFHFTEAPALRGSTLWSTVRFTTNIFVSTDLRSVI